MNEVYHHEGPSRDPEKGASIGPSNDQNHKTPSTPRAFETRHVALVSPSSDATSSEANSSEKTRLCVELEEARRDAAQAGAALEAILDGIRGVKRLLVAKASSSEDPTDATILDINILCQKLPGVLGSDLMSLVNAAGMIEAHEKLARQETTNLIHDIATQKERADLSELEAKRAKKLSRALYQENCKLSSDVQRLKLEREALIKEVKSLRKDAEETRKFDSWRLLEEHVLGSMAIHEKVLKTPSTPKENCFKDSTDATQSESVNDTTLIQTENTPQEESAVQEVPQGSNQDTTRSRMIKLGSGFGGFRGALGTSFGNRKSIWSRRSQNDSEAESNLVSQGSATVTHSQQQTPITRGVKSPVPNLDEVSTFTEDSEDMAETMQQIDPPRSHFKTLRVDTQGVVSPLVTPGTSPAGIGSPEYKPICDPKILRTLAIPSNVKASVDYKNPSPSSRSAGNLYEC